ncbi:TonB-dependent receptor plug domain-containing protein [Parahaliea mediterranea]|uniref:TonB-dependent receptor n=1 Tax=Parahaliea mediterranea TaxID=651086 RepID=A0A939DDQ7_9GAMM|nr:TonB-dependent receptor [Parahaliea mediterranea]MBN7796225.1 TonB-dependent receptor [Parahaliea mediterranea]
MKRIAPLAALACAPALYAATDIPARDTRSQYSMEEVVVSSSRVPMPLRQVGTSVSVITEEDIRNQGFDSLYNVLRSQPGIAASNTGGAGKPTALRVRGEEGYRTKVYIDGIDVADTSATQHGPRFEEILSAGVRRVEILRGPQGLMYGADAGGVVNISTRSGEPGLQGVVSAEGGRYGTRQLTADIGGGNEQVDFALSATDFETDGFNARGDDTSAHDDDGYDNTTLHGRVGWNASENLRLELVARNTEGENAYDDCFTVDTFAPTDACGSDFEQDAWRAAIDYQAGRFGHQLAYTGNDTERQNYADGLPSFGADGSLDKWGYLGNFAASEDLRLVYGAERLTESIDDGSFDRERDQDSVFFEVQGGFGDALYLTAGARHDDNEDFGSHTSYRVSGAYLIDMAGGELKFKSAYGTGFRAPSLYEIAYNISFATPPASTVELDAEQSEGLDVGVVWANDDGLYLEATYFDQRIEDAIYFDLNNYSGYLQDDGNSDSSGVELIARLPLGETFWLGGNYTYNDSEDADGSTRVRRPEHLANLSFNWQPLNGDLLLALHVRSARDAEGIDGEALDDYEVVDLNASYALWRGLEIYGRVENLLDEDYQEVRGYNTAGAAAYAGVRYSF